jgi:hypothetical protein
MTDFERGSVEEEIIRRAVDYVDPETGETDLDGFAAHLKRHRISVPQHTLELALEQRSHAIIGESHD